MRSKISARSTEMTEAQKIIKNRTEEAAEATQEKLFRSVVVCNDRFVLIDKQKEVILPLSVMKFFPSSQTFNLRVLNLFRTELEAQQAAGKRETDVSKALADKLGLKHEHARKLRLDLGKIDGAETKITDGHVFYDPMTGEHRILANGELVKGYLESNESLRKKQQEYHRTLMQHARDEGRSDEFITAPLGFAHGYATALLGKKGK